VLQKTRSSSADTATACCFVLLIPTPEEYRVPRVNPRVTASKLFPPLLPSLATPGPPLPYRPLQSVPVLLSVINDRDRAMTSAIWGARAPVHQRRVSNGGG